jgi:hypothetical protein
VLRDEGRDQHLVHGALRGTPGGVTAIVSLLAGVQARRGGLVALRGRDLRPGTSS